MIDSAAEAAAKNLDESGRQCARLVCGELGSHRAQSEAHRRLARPAAKPLLRQGSYRQQVQRIIGNGKTTRYGRTPVWRTWQDQKKRQGHSKTLLVQAEANRLQAEASLLQAMANGAMSCGFHLLTTAWVERQSLTRCTLRTLQMHRESS